MDLPPSSLRGVYQVNEGIPVPLRRQVATVRKEGKSIIVSCSRHGDERLPHQGRPGCAGIGCQVLSNVAVVPPVVNESKLKKCRSDAMERQNIVMGQSTPDRDSLPQNLKISFVGRPPISTVCSPLSPLSNFGRGIFEKP